MDRSKVAIRSLAANVVVVAAVACGADEAGGNGTPAPPPATQPGTVTPTPEAGVGLETEHEYPPATATLTAARPVTVEVPGTDDIADRLARLGDGAEAVVEIVFEDPSAAPGFTMVVFVGTPGADAETAPSAPGFLGSVSFLRYPSDDQPARARLPARDAIERTGVTEDLQITLVPIAGSESSQADDTYQATVKISVVRTTG